MVTPSDYGIKNKDLNVIACVEWLFFLGLVFRSYGFDSASGNFLIIFIKCCVARLIVGNE